jgi:hypothetical protein
VIKVGHFSVDIPMPDVAVSKKWPARRSLGEVWWRGQDSNLDLDALSQLSYLAIHFLSFKLLLEMRLFLSAGPYKNLFKCLCRLNSPWHGRITENSLELKSVK